MSSKRILQKIFGYYDYKKKSVQLPPISTGHGYSFKWASETYKLYMERDVNLIEIFNKIFSTIPGTIKKPSYFGHEVFDDGIWYGEEFNIENTPCLVMVRETTTREILVVVIIFYEHPQGGGDVS